MRRNNTCYPLAIGTGFAVMLRPGRIELKNIARFYRLGNIDTLGKISPARHEGTVRINISRGTFHPEYQAKRKLLDEVRRVLRILFKSFRMVIMNKKVSPELRAIIITTGDQVVGEFVADITSVRLSNMKTESSDQETITSDSSVELRLETGSVMPEIL